MGCIFIIAGGSIGNKDFLRTEIETFGPDELVCADGGARHVVALDLTPQVIIGDMDSLPPEIIQHCEERGSRIIRHPRAKKETDTQLALEYVCRSHPGEIRIYGGLGGRIDHALANISLLLPAARRGVTTKLVDEWCEVLAITQTTQIEGVAGQTISLFPLTALVQGIELEGFEYPLSGGTMEIGAPYGISNRLQAERGVIAIESGCLLVVKYFKPGMFPAGDEKEMSMKPARVLSVAGSDPGGGAGIQADVKTVTVLGGFGMSVITAITVQNTLGVQDVYPLPPDLVARQFDAVAKDIGIDAVKTGMLPNREIMAVVVHKIREYGLTRVVVDPVLAAKRGEVLMNAETITMLMEELLPQALVVTPNIPEAEVLSGMIIASLEDMRKAALIIYRTGVGNVVIKGGHLPGMKDVSLDILYDGNKFHEFSSPRIDTRDTHGTGCAYASAMATFLAGGSNVKEAVKGAKDYITAAIRHAWRLGGGQAPVNHLAPLLGPSPFGKGGLRGIS